MIIKFTKTNNSGTVSIPKLLILVTNVYQMSLQKLLQREEASKYRDISL